LGLKFSLLDIGNYSYDFSSPIISSLIQSEIYY
jgi:hypothetical protein